jgi:P2-related tail formation protein
MNAMTIDMRRLVPAFILADRNGAALAKAIEACMVTTEYIARRGVSYVLDVSQMPEWRLDEMAWEYDVKWYDYNADAETKRRIILGMEDVFRRAGTRYAITQMIGRYFGDGECEEWFDYGAEPFHFRVVTVNDAASGEKRAQMENMAEVLKSLRSVFDGAQIERSGRVALMGGAHLSAGGTYRFTVEGL